MSNPSGQQADFFGIKVSIPGINVNQAGDSELILKDDYNSRVYYDPNGVPNVLLGKRTKNSSNNLSTNQRGLFVSQSGIDVTQATDSQLIFNSNQDVFKIVKIMEIPVGGVSWSGAGYSQATAQAAHGLSFIPTALAYVNSGGGYQLLPAITTNYNSGIYIVSVNVYVDATNVTLINSVANQGTSSGSNSGFTAKVYLLQETATL